MGGGCRRWIPRLQRETHAATSITIHCIKDNGCGKWKDACWYIPMSRRQQCECAHEQLEICFQEMGGCFDCALCNHYPNQESACKFHTDPEHGSFWERMTCVVSAGNEDVPKGAFRPIPDINEWDKYESLKSQGDNGDGFIPAVIYLFPGNVRVVEMHAECNDLFHHAVYGRQDVGVGVDTASSGLTSRIVLMMGE